jgi:hypothetical protein
VPIIDVRPFGPADLGRLLQLTIATFGAFYEQSFRGIVGDTVMANQHGNWRQDYHDQWAGPPRSGQRQVRGCR